jgi:hypothetical protein
VTDIDLTPSGPPARSSRFLLVAVAAAVVAVLGVVVAVATGGDDDDAGEPIELLSAAPDAVREAGTARLTIDMEMAAEGMSMDVGGSGVVDFASGDMTFEMAMMGTSFEMRMVDGTMYMRMPDVGVPTGVTTAWVAMPVEGNMAAQPGFNGATSLTGFVDALRGVAGEIEDLGEDEVNGVQARGFRVEIDVEKAIAELPEDQRADAEAGLEEMQAMGMSAIPMEIWITDDAIPVRMIMDMTSSMFDMKMTMDLTDFGLDADIQAPPEADVTRVGSQAELQEIMTGGMMDAAA